jgi:hypothetical protein
MNKDFKIDEQSEVFLLLSKAYIILLGDTHKRITLKEQDQVLEMVQDARMIMIGNKREAV